MIVVDSNVVAYCWINGPLSATAQRVRAKDPGWHVPVLWRSELRSILAGYLRDGTLSAAQIARVMEATEAALAGCEHLVSSANVFGSWVGRSCRPTTPSSWLSPKRWACRS